MVELSQRDTAELAAFAEQFPEEAPYIEQAITLRRLALEEFDRLVRERPIASPLLRLKQLAAAPLKPTEAAQKVLDVDGRWSVRSCLEPRRDRPSRQLTGLSVYRIDLVQRNTR